MTQTVQKNVELWVSETTSVDSDSIPDSDYSYRDIYIDIRRICSNCGSRGHNKRTCKEPLRVKQVKPSKTDKKEKSCHKN